jgi:hypothetical protein
MTYTKPPPPMDIYDVVFIVSALVAISVAFVAVWAGAAAMEDAAIERCAAFCTRHHARVRSWDGVECVCAD